MIMNIQNKFKSCIAQSPFVVRCELCEPRTITEYMHVLSCSDCTIRHPSRLTTFDTSGRTDLGERYFIRQVKTLSMSL